MNKILYCAAAALLLTSCSSDPDYGDFVARLGTRTLTREDIRNELANSPMLQDSTEARAQIVERWVTNELLFQEAVDAGLREDPDVKRLLADNERSVLISALVNQFYAEEATDPDESTLRTYYEQHREQLSLREPFIQVRLLTFADESEAARAHDSLRIMPVDELGQQQFEAYAERVSQNAAPVIEMSESWYPQSQLLARYPRLNDVLDRMKPEDVTLPFVSDRQFLVLQLMDRIPAGTIPEMELLSDNLRDRVAIEMRKQLYARQVQRLRTRALAREELEIRE